jgi:hypothetical protein
LHSPRLKQQPRSTTSAWHNKFLELSPLPGVDSGLWRCMQTVTTLFDRGRKRRKCSRLALASVVALGICCALPLQVNAQSVPPLSMAEAIQLALAHNRSILMAAVDVKRADAEIKAASTRRFTELCCIRRGRKVAVTALSLFPGRGIGSCRRHADPFAKHEALLGTGTDSVCPCTGARTVDATISVEPPGEGAKGRTRDQ